MDLKLWTHCFIVIPDFLSIDGKFSDFIDVGISYLYIHALITLETLPFAMSFSLANFIVGFSIQVSFDYGCSY